MGKSLGLVGSLAGVWRGEGSGDAGAGYEASMQSP